MKNPKNLYFAENRMVFVRGGDKLPVHTASREVRKAAADIKKIAKPDWLKKFKAQKNEKKQAYQVGNLLLTKKPNGLGYKKYTTDASVDPMSRGFRFTTPDNKPIATANFVKLCKDTAKELKKNI